MWTWKNDKAYIENYLIQLFNLKNINYEKDDKIERMNYCFTFKKSLLDNWWDYEDLTSKKSCFP